MQIRNYATMKSLDYHNGQLEYNITSLKAQVKESDPDAIDPDLNDPKYRHIIEASPFNPKALGDLAESLGIDKKVITVDLWEDLQNGWCQVDESSPFWAQAEDTPRGKMVKLNKSALSINEAGQYDYEGASKDRRPGMEFLPTFGERFSVALGLMSTQDPTVLPRFEKLCRQVLQEHIVPEITKLTRIRKGADGVDLECAAEITCVSFMHVENRAEAPHIHFHVDFLNTALGYDGKLYAACTDEVGANWAAIDALWTMTMKPLLEQEFGFSFVEVKHEKDVDNEYLQHHERKTVTFDLPESVIPAGVMEWRRERDRAMQAELDKLRKEGKAAGYTAEEIARVESREEKSELSPAELQAKWDAVFKSHGWTVEQFKEEMDAYKLREAEERQQIKRPTLEDMQAAFLRHAKTIEATEYQIKAHFIKELLPFMSSAEAERESTKLFEGLCDFRMEREKKNYFQDFLDGKVSDPIEHQSKQLRFHKEARFIFKDVIAKEQECCDIAEARQNEMQFRLDPKLVAQYIVNYEAQKSEELGKPFKLSNDQRNAVFACSAQPGALATMKGRAGSGKSTAMEMMVQMWEAEGFNTWGTSISSAATQNLAKAAKLDEKQCMNATLLLKLIEAEKVSLNNKSILIFDEAGMADSFTYHKLMKHCEKTGAKLVLAGESHQLQPVGAGGVFNRLSQDFVNVPLTQINRQHDTWQREMVEDFASGRSNKAVKTLYENGKVIITKTEKERLGQIVEDYIHASDSSKLETTVTGKQAVTFVDQAGQQTTVTLDKLELAGRTYEGQELQTLLSGATGKQALAKCLGVEVAEVTKVAPETFSTAKRIDPKEKVIIASTNADIERLNETVRDRLKALGQLPQEEVVVKCKDKQERAFAVGDRIVITKNQKTDDAITKKLNNAETGEVVAIMHSKLTGKPKTMKLRMDDGKEAFLELSKDHAIKHAYALTVHKSQGQTKDAAFYWVSANGNSLHQAYVACSRHRKDLRMYLSEDMVRSMEDKIKGKPATASMKKTATWVAQEKGIDLPPETFKSFRDTRAFLDKHYTKATGQEPHPLDRFTNIVEAMAKTNFKKTSFDFEVLDGKARNTYEAIKTAIFNRTRKAVAMLKPAPEAIKAQVAVANQVTHAQRVAATQAVMPKTPTVKLPPQQPSQGIRI